MKLAVRKEPGHIPGSGFHYHLMPFKIETDAQATIYEHMGLISIEVPDEVGLRLLKEAAAALLHQVEIAILAEKEPTK